MHTNHSRQSIRRSRNRPLLAASVVVLALVAAGCGPGAKSAVSTIDPCALASVAQVQTIFPDVARAQPQGSNECDYYPGSGPWKSVAYLAIQKVVSKGQGARAFVATGAPPGAIIGTLPGIGDSAAYQMTPATPSAHLPAALVALAAVKADRVVIITLMGPLNDFPAQAPGGSGFGKARALLSRVVAKL